MIGSHHHLFFQEKTIFFQANKSSETGVPQPSPAIVMLDLPVQKECREMGRELFEMRSSALPRAMQHTDFTEKKKMVKV